MALLLDPLVIVLVVLAVGLALLLRPKGAPQWSRRARIGFILAWVAWGLTYVFSSSVFSSRFVHHYESIGADLDKVLGPGEHPDVALVVLAGGPRTNNHAFPWSERIDGSSQARTLAAARLDKQYGFGVVIPTGAPPIMAMGMDELLVRLGTPKEKIREETRATSTRENARYCADMLRELGIRRVVLVTSALHLRRATKYFEREGLEVYGAIADLQSFDTDSINSVSDFLPSSDAMFQSQMALHEVLGRIAQAMGR